MGGSVHELNNGLKAQLIMNELNIKQFGAKGDGVTDDTSYFKSAINYLKSFSTKSIALNINSGNYLITSSIELPLYISLVSLGNVKFIYTGENEFLHFINTEIISHELSQNAYNIRNILDGSKGTIIIQGSGSSSNQTGIKIGEDTLGTLHVTHSGWFNITNIYIEKFSIGIYFTNIQNYMQRFYNVVISNCGIGINNSSKSTTNSGEIITFNSCAILNNNIGIQIDNIINFNFDNCSIDYNQNGIILNYGGYYELNLTNCWLEANNNIGESYLIKSNSTSSNLTTVNCDNCYIFPRNKIPSTQFYGKMFLNLKGCSFQANRYTQGNYAEGEFLCNNDVVLNSLDGIHFIENPIVASSNLAINKNWNFSAGENGSNIIDGFQIIGGEGSSSVKITNSKYYTSDKSIQFLGDGTYNTIKTNKIDVSKYNFIIGDALIYMSDIDGGSNGLNITTTIKFYDEKDIQIGNSISYTQNFTYDAEKLNQWFSIPQGINDSINNSIRVPYNAKTCDIQLAIGNIKSEFFIDNIIIIGF